MPITTRVQQAYRADEKHNHALLSEEERQKLIKVRNLTAKFQLIELTTHRSLSLNPTKLLLHPRPRMRHDDPD